MGMKTRMALAGGFVGVVAMAAAAFGQTGSPTPEPRDSERPRSRSTAAPSERRAQAQRPRAERGCDRPAPRRARRVVHSETKVKTEKGFAIVTVDQGEITSIDHGDKKLTIKRLDGESVTGTATDETRICKDGKPSSFDALKKGDLARLVHVRSERFTGLRRIGAITPGSTEDPPARAAADFDDEEFGDLLDGTF